jgi:anaerobic selenocysteine-containing dehydrogenase
MSLTAANADEWLAAPPGYEHLVALAIANVILKEGLNRAPAPSDLASVIEASAPESVSSATGISAERLTRLARDFGKAERPLAIGAAPAGEMRAINLLNSLMDVVNKKGGVLVQPAANGPSGPLKAAAGTKRPTELTHAQFPETLRTRPVRALMIHNFNPAFVTPEVRESMLKVPFVACFSTIIDETAALSDMLLPDNSYLERWDLHSSFGNDGAEIFSLTQPVIESQLNTRQTADILLEVARIAGEPAAAALPFASSKEIVEGAVRPMKQDYTEEGTVGIRDYPASRSQPAEAETEEEGSNPLWDELSARGFITTTAKGVKGPDSKGSAAQVAAAKAQSSKAQSSDAVTARTELRPGNEYPLTLVIYETTLGDGRMASLPSLQELPDPMTSVLWGSWLEINPATAKSLDVSDGDLVEVANDRGLVRVPAVLTPAIRPDVVAMPFGQGHESYGRYAGGRGSSPVSLMEITKSKSSGERNDMHAGVRVTRAGTRGQLIRFGTELMEHMEFKR